MRPGRWHQLILPRYVISPLSGYYGPCSSCLNTESEISGRARRRGPSSKVCCRSTKYNLRMCRQQLSLSQSFSQKLQELIRRGSPRDLAQAQELMKQLSGAVSTELSNVVHLSSADTSHWEYAGTRKATRLRGTDQERAGKGAAKGHLAQRYAEQRGPK
jgi:hypothetical protein